MELRSIHVNDTADRQYVTLVEKLEERLEAGDAGAPAGGPPKAASGKAASAKTAAGKAGPGKATSGKSPADAPESEAASARTLTIVIGWNEVQAVDRFVKGARPPRPLTHELLVSLLEASGATLERVDVTELKEGTFYAVLRLKRADGQTVDVDARPSDALALATALAKPIFVAEAVIEAALSE